MRHHLGPAPHPLAAALALAASLGAGCRHGGEVLVTGAPTAFFFEDEPNDDPDHPQPIGPVHPPEQLVIRGDLGSVWGPYFDDADVFALQAASPTRIRFHLECTGGDGDFDLCLFDPFLGEVVAHWDAWGDEHGSFDVPGAGQDFQLLVLCYSGSGTYDLELRVDPLPAYAPAPTTPRAVEGPAPEDGADPKPGARARLEALFVRGRQSDAERARREGLARSLAEAAALRD